MNFSSELGNICPRLWLGKAMWVGKAKITVLLIKGSGLVQGTVVIGVFDREAAGTWGKGRLRRRKSFPITLYLLIYSHSALNCEILPAFAFKGRLYG